MAESHAIKWLRAQAAEFAVHAYEYDRIGAEAAAEAIGQPLELVCKTLIVETPGQRFCAAIVPGDQRFDARRVAAAMGVKKADLADSDKAEKITGYRVGGISPFGLRRKLPVLIEESLLAVDRLIVNGGGRGLLVELATPDLVRLLDARSANLCG